MMSVNETMAWCVLAFFFGWALGGFARDRVWIAASKHILERGNRWSDSIWVHGRRFFVIEHGDLEHVEDLHHMQSWERRTSVKTKEVKL
jgi:hypothetical protein